MVIQQGLRTPTELRFENCCTPGIRGLLFGSPFTRRSTKPTALFFAVASAVQTRAVGLRFRPGCSTDRLAPAAAATKQARQQSVAVLGRTVMAAGGDVAAHHLA